MSYYSKLLVGSDKTNDYRMCYKLRHGINAKAGDDR